MICHFDRETRSELDVTRVGAHTYARHPSTVDLCVGFLFPDGTAGVWANPDYSPERIWGLDGDGEPVTDYAEDLAAKWDEWVMGGGIVCAHNAEFDWAVGEEQQRRGARHLANPPLEQVVCSQAQTENYSLPGGLAKAARALKLTQQKDTEGKRLIKLFCDANREFPADRVDEWIAFMRYCLQDIRTQAALWEHTRPWTAEEWEDWRVVARMNARGMCVDVDLAAEAVKWSKREHEALNRELQTLTDDPEMTLAHSARKLEWFRDLVDGSELQDVATVTKTKTETDPETGEKTRRSEKKLSLGRPARQAVRDFLDEVEGADDVDEKVLAFFDLLDRGGGVATKKFSAILRMVGDDDRLRGQYVCSPTITGRHSGRGVQVHNLIRAKLEADVDQTIDLLFEAKIASVIEEYTGLSLPDALSRLIRPTIIAPEGGVLVWGDWSQIEARVLPWLAGADEALEPYRRGEDQYVKTAAMMYGLPEADIDKDRRLRGKISELALGFGGGGVALRNMAMNYGLKLPFGECEEMKLRWRAAKPWAPTFWHQLEATARRALTRNRVPCEVPSGGPRIVYVRVDNDLWCITPSGYPIVYPECRIERVFKENWEKWVNAIRYRKMYSGQVMRGELYGGLLAENVTQHEAAILLRQCLRRLDSYDVFDLVGTTHDEILTECDEADADEVESILGREMLYQPAWAGGLPLACEIEKGYYYGK